MLKVNNLQFSYPTGERFDFPDLECASGSQWLLLGPSGSGKSTLLHLLGGLLSPTGGTLELNGQRYDGLRGSQLDAFRGQHIGMVFQKAYFVASLSVAENLGLAQRLGKQKVDRQRNLALLEELGIGRQASKYGNQLSIGEQQRASIARGLVNRPALLLADEPTAALDAANAAIVSKLLRQRAEQLNAILLVVTHDERLLPDFNNVLRLSGASEAKKN